MNIRVKTILVNSLSEFDKSSIHHKIDLLEYVTEQLHRHMKGEAIGFPLDEDMVTAGEIFTRIAYNKLKKQIE